MISTVPRMQFYAIEIARYGLDVAGIRLFGHSFDTVQKSSRLE